MEKNTPFLYGISDVSRQQETVVRMMDPTETMYRDLVEYQQDLIVRFNPEGRLIFVNSAYCKAVGKTREALAGTVFMPVTSERYADIIATRMTNLFRPPFACTVEQWIQTPVGMRCFSWSAKSVLDDSNAVVSIVAAGRDITRFKNEQRAIKKKDEELMLVIESGNQMYYTHTPDHTLMFVSPRLRALLGCRPNDGKRIWTDYLTDNPINGAGLERTIKAIASARREPPYRLEMSSPDGRLILLEVNEIPLVKNGKTVSIAGFVTDVTEKALVEEGLAEAEFLIPDLASANKRIAGQPGYPVRPSKKPRGFFQSLFSRKPDEEVDDVFSNLPRNLK
ncbi:MAG: PAS domain-containing protein [Methanoregula sp.]|nr:PAS domain-containing protein [Methanoregula sp.]